MAFATTLAAVATDAPAQSIEEPLPDDSRVENAIAEACYKLKKYQREDGSWVDYYRYDGATTALALQALLLAGEPPASECIKKGIEALGRYNPEETYTRSLRAMTYALLVKDYPKLRSKLAADAAWLARIQKPDGMWNYGTHRDKGLPDNSNTQFAVLGLRDAASANIEIPSTAWKRLYTHYTTTQIEDGGWSYQKPTPEKKMSSMVTITAPCLASLMIVNDELMKNAGCPCRGDRSGGNRLNEEHIDKAIEWLVEFFDSGRKDDRMEQYQTYFYYGLLRAAQASGMKTIGKHDWYKRGLRAMFQTISRDCVRRANAVNDLDKDGKPIIRDTYDQHFVLLTERNGRKKYYLVLPDALVDMSLATIFLVKGSSQIYMNKLRYDGQWNRHRRDLAMITDYVGKTLERPMRWQVVDIASDPQLWVADTPLLYLTGEEQLKLTDEQKERLKKFCLMGGTLLIEANCGNKKFMQQARALIAELWPDWPLKPLADDHPLYNCHLPVDTREISLFEGVDDGIRTFVLLTDKDFSCSWQLKMVDKQKPLHDMGLNLFAYATDKAAADRKSDTIARIQLRQQQIAEWEEAWEAEKKLATEEKRRTEKPKKAWEAKPPKVQKVRLKAGQKKTIDMALLDHQGNFRLGLHYDVLNNIVASLQKEVGVTLVFNAAMKADEIEPGWPAVLIVRGDEPLGLDEDAIKNFAAYAGGGGFVIAEAVMGRSGFDADFRKLIEAAGLTLEPVAENDPLITGQLGDDMQGAPVVQVRFTRAVQQQLKPIEGTGLLAIRKGEKTVGYYSPLDLMYSATGLAAYDIRGYDQQTASAVLVNMLLVPTR